MTGTGFMQDSFEAIIEETAVAYAQQLVDIDVMTDIGIETAALLLGILQLTLQLTEQLVDRMGPLLSGTMTPVNRLTL